MDGKRNLQEEKSENLTENNFVGKDFLQSDEWRRFQESVGRKVFQFSENNFQANITERNLPFVGNYFYIPRGPIFSENINIEIGKNKIQKLIELAKREKIGWIRFDPMNEKILEFFKKNTKSKIIKAPHDMQPKEIFVMDILKSEENLLAEMKAKTRYNIKLAEKKGVVVDDGQNSKNRKYVEEFLNLTEIMAKRNKIVSHSEDYYRKMLETISENVLKLYVAKYKEKVIVANLMVFFDKTCIYLHGASDDEFRNVMAPYFLQWRQICDAKKAGCVRYDFGGIDTKNEKKSWAGITRFKKGFSPKTKSVEFPGSYDIVINPARYFLYRKIQKIKSVL